MEIKKKIPNFICGPNIMIRRGPPKVRLNPIDQSELDPRPPQPCVKNPCCACFRSSPSHPPVPCFGLKLKQLENCYNCKVSNACQRRKSNFYSRWQTYLDRLPIRYPNYDYTTYCCDDYVDMSVNRDFDRSRYSNFRKNVQGQRRRAHLNFLWPKVLSESLGEQEMERSCCGDTEECPCKCAHLCNWEDMREQMANQVQLYQDDGDSYWRQKQLAPSGYAERATLVKNRLHPFRKDASFSSPLDELVTGRNIPFKKIRDLKNIA